MNKSFVEFLVDLAETTEKKITERVKELAGYTLKHWGGRQPQEPHGWRYGANILRPNGMGDPSVERGRAYLQRITGRDLNDALTGSRIAAGAGNNRGIKNVHMEYQRRSRGGDSKLRRWDKGERDMEYGRSLADQRGTGTSHSGNTARAGTNKPSNESKNQKWSATPAKLRNPAGDPKDRRNRVHGGKGLSDPWKNRRGRVKADRAAGRKLIKDVRKSPIPDALGKQGLASQRSATGGRGGTYGAKYMSGSSNKKGSQFRADTRAQQLERFDRNVAKRKKVTPEQQARSAARKRENRLRTIRKTGISEGAGRIRSASFGQRRQGNTLSRKRKKELSIVNPILGGIMEVVHAHVEKVLLEKHKELFVPLEHTSPYRELAAYKAKAQDKSSKPDKGEYDEEGGMAKSQLQSVIRNAKAIHDLLQDDTNVAEWAQSKIALAEDYVSTVSNYIQNNSSQSAKKELGESLIASTFKAKDAAPKKSPPESKTISDAVRTGLKKKVADHNKKYGEVASKRVTFSMLERVFRRGVGAYQTNPGSVRPNVSGPDQWAYARVNAFLAAIRSGKYQSGKFDTDILPKKHALSSRKSTSKEIGGMKIYIDPANIGKFNATKKRTGKSTEELTHSKNPLTQKRAVFAKNAAQWGK